MNTGNTLALRLKAWLYRNAALLTLLAPVLLLSAVEAWARAGGGSHYSTGSRGSGGSSSGGGRSG